jgi:sec-independent protein translocase protein TatA
MGTWSIGHWIVVAIVLVLLFGTKRLKNLGGDLGGAMRDFRKAFKDGKQEEESGEAPRLQADPPPEQTSQNSSEKRDKVS